MLAMSAGAWAQSQPLLGSGRWWKMGVSEEGVYSITPRDIPELLGTSVDSLGVYGGSGSMLSTQNSEAPINDLKPIRIDIMDRNSNHFLDSDD